MQIVSIQILRGLAALAVAIGHAQGFIGFPLERRGEEFAWSYLLPWGAGVDLFFVISGFVMVYASESLFRTPGGMRSFLWRRLCRIIPLYWILTGFIILKEILKGANLPDTSSLLTSPLFIPHDASGTGTARPIYELGWTLNYEMLFYAVFALTVGFSRKIAVLPTSCLLFVVVAVLPHLFPHSTVVSVWSQPIVIEFVLGMGIALLVRSGYTLPGSARIGLMALGVAALLFDGLATRAHTFDWITPNDGLRVLAWGLPASLIVAAAVMGPMRWTEGSLTRAAIRLGDASYALYLCHPIVISAFSAAWFFAGLHRFIPSWIAVAMSLGLAIAAARVIYRWFELPVTNYLKSLNRPKLQAGDSSLQVS